MQSNCNTDFHAVVNHMARKLKFILKYRDFTSNPTEQTYNSLISYVNYSISEFLTGVWQQGGLFGNDPNVMKVIENVLCLYDANGKIFYNSKYRKINYNTYEKYQAGKILANVNLDKSSSSFVMSAEKNVVGVIYSNVREIPTGNMGVEATANKKVVYIGYAMTYSSMMNFVDTAYSNGITHICLEFVQLLNNSTSLSYADTVASWMGFTNDQRNNVINSMNAKGMKLLLSFGGAYTFNEDGFQAILTWPTYYDPEKLASDLVDHCKTYRYHGVDLDIEHYPSINENVNIDDLADYAGLLSNYIKTLSNQRMGYYIIVSHAPQSPYFNGSYYGYVYSKIEKKYGYAIDFYNIQYYNQGFGLYETYESIFGYDSVYFASVTDLMTRGNIDSNCAIIPSYKIVVGKVSRSGEAGYGGYVPLYVSPLTPSNCMAGFVEATKYDTRSQILQWVNDGGVMVWFYDIEGKDPDMNTTVINYFKHLKTNWK